MNSQVSFLAFPRRMSNFHRFYFIVFRKCRSSYHCINFYLSNSQISSVQLITLSLFTFCLHAISPQNILIPVLCTISRDNSVAITMDYELDGRGSIPGKDKRFFSSSQYPNWLCDPSRLLSNGHRRLLAWRQSAGAWNCYSPSSSVGVKNGRAIPIFPSKSSWRDAWLIKHRDNFTLHLHLHEVFLQPHYLRRFCSSFSPLDLP
jgi:hypothetical protein